MLYLDMERSYVTHLMDDLSIRQGGGIWDQGYGIGLEGAHGSDNESKVFVTVRHNDLIQLDTSLNQ